MSVAGTRVQQLRELYGFTQASLAEQADVSQPTVARLEKGQPVSSESVTAIARALNADRSLLDLPPPVQFTGSTIRFRAHSSLRAWERYRAHRWGEVAYEVFCHLRKSVKLPEPVALAQPFSSDPERAAALTRERLRLPNDQPLPNLTRTLERSGVRVLLLPLEGSVHAGYSLQEGVHELEPIVCLFRGVSADRARFTLAHEIGHLVLHGGRADRQPEAEDEAQRFAGAFLIPEAPFLADLQAMPANVLSTYVRLKPRWGVSIQGLIMRAHHLGRVSEWQKRRLFTELSSRGWRTREPVEIPPESPRQMLKALEIAYGQPASLGPLARDTGMPEMVLKQLFPEAAMEQARDAQIIPLHAARRRPTRISPEQPAEA